MNESYHLCFEIIPFDEEIPLDEHVAHLVRGQLENQNIRKWVYVPSADVQNINVCRLVDRDGPFFISNTEFYLPSWLQNCGNIIEPENRTLLAIPDHRPRNVEIEPHPDASEISNGSNRSSHANTINISQSNSQMFMGNTNTCVSIAHTEEEHDQICGRRQLDKTDYRSISIELDDSIPIVNGRNDNLDREHAGVSSPLPVLGILGNSSDEEGAVGYLPISNASGNGLDDESIVEHLLPSGAPHGNYMDKQSGMDRWNVRRGNIMCSTMVNSAADSDYFGGTFEMPVTLIEMSNSKPSSQYGRKNNRIDVANVSDLVSDHGVSELASSFDSISFSGNLQPDLRLTNSPILQKSLNVDEILTADESILNGSIDQTPTEDDFRAVKMYADKILDFHSRKEKMIQREAELQNLFLEAARKTAAERINFDSKGEPRNPRFVQILNRFSIRTIKISEEAKDARDVYNKMAKQWIDERVVKMPNPCEFPKRAFERVSAAGAVIPSMNYAKKDFVQYETALQIESTNEFKKMLAEMQEAE